MKRGPLASLLISAFLSISVQAHGGPFPGPDLFGPAFGPHHPHPAFYDVMPPGYKTVIAAGVTYFVLDNLWYVMHGNRYEQVSQPTNVTVINSAPTTTVVTTDSGMKVVDVNGIRYYTEGGHYYRRDINGQMLEVAPPL